MQVKSEKEYTRLTVVISELWFLCMLLFHFLILFCISKFSIISMSNFYNEKTTSNKNKCLSGS